jgi:nitroreductase
MYTCRSIRRIKPDPVPQELLVKPIDAASPGASRSNTQHARYIVVRHRGQREKLAELSMNTFRPYIAPNANLAASVPHLSAEKREKLISAVRWQAEHFAEIPAIVIPCVELGAPSPDAFAAGPQTGGSVWPGVQHLLLAARALGLGATPNTFALQDRAAAKTALSLPETIMPLCVNPVGYPLGEIGPLSRRPVAEIMRWDRWS